MSNTTNPDPIDYQLTVAESKHSRIRRASNSELVEVGVITPDDLESHTAMVAFDTVIWAWDQASGKYISKEKPKNREEAIATIDLLVSGEQVLVSTVANVQSLMQLNEIGNSSTILPVRLVTKNRFERLALRERAIELYDLVVAGRAGKWKLTPTGTVSFMHPELQKYVEVGITDDIEDNVLPNDFSRFELQQKPSQGFEYRPTRHRDIGDRAYKVFADRIIQKGGYRRMSRMHPDMRQQVGMVFSGYSEVGMLKAFEQYLQVVGAYKYSQLMAYRREQQILQMLLKD